MDAAGSRIGNLLGHRSHRETPVGTGAVATQGAPGVLVKVEGVEGAVEAGLEVAQQDIDSAELREVVGVAPAGENSLVVAVGRGHRPETGQAT